MSESPEERQRKERKKMYLTVADLSTMGFAMVLSIVLGLVAGFFLDSRLGTEPIFTFVFLFGGIMAGFRMMYKTYMRFFSEDKSHGDRP
ncbi:MAG TPA: AtpZ/AtpI family protein [Deltaproteobacteria bacterium]|nr:AtpZ/AtpI family protein [Deltaproteobacteria bacterium]